MSFKQGCMECSGGKMVYMWKGKIITDGVEQQSKTSKLMTTTKSVTLGTA